MAGSHCRVPWEALSARHPERKSPARSPLAGVSVSPERDLAPAAGWQGHSRAASVAETMPANC
jgi:hypothetical protein